MRNKYLIFIITCIITATCMASATTPAKDSTLPLNITSDYAEFDDQNGIATYTGNVVSIQGSRRLASDTLVINRSKANKIELVTATGQPANFQSQPNADKPMGFGKANLIKYFPDEDKVELIGNAEVTQNSDIVQGQFLTYYFNTGLLQSKPTDQSRTTVILKPKEDTK